MRLKGNIAADMIFHGAKKYGETKTRMAKVTLEIKIQEEDAKDKCGADFHRVAFGAMTVKEGTVSFPCGVMTKPNLVVEVHEVDLLGTPVKVSPEIPKITPIENEPAVTVTMVLPLEVNQLRKDLYGELTCASGDLIECEFEPIQGDIEQEIEKKAGGMTMARKDGAFGNPTPVLVEG